MERERVLVSGGTGFLGSHIVKELLKRGHHVVSFASGEHDHEKQKRELQSYGDSFRSWIGNVRDYPAVLRAIRGCDTVYHAAAQKCVPWAEDYPEECIQTNVQGTINVQRAAEEAGVNRAVYISSDKACKPINTYGASKYLGEKVWSGPVVRLGNLWGSTGSVIYWLLQQRGTGKIKITSRKMRRFHIRVEEAVNVVLSADEGLTIPQMAWYQLDDLAKAVDPDAEIIETGIRPGEKLAEDLYEEGTPYPSTMRLSVDELKAEIECLSGSMGMAVTGR